MKEKNHKIVVGSGWWCSGKRSQWNIGDDLIRSPDFFQLWHRQVLKYINPEKIIVVDSNSPIKPNPENLEKVEFISLDKNYGHANDIRADLVDGKICGFNRAIILSATYAMCCDADYYVYIEQDCVIKGHGFVEKAIGGQEFDFFCGQRTEGGQGLHGNTAAPMLQQSVQIVKKSKLETFISKLINAPESDGEMSPERKMERDMAPYGLLQVPYGRSRPIDFTLSHYYAQHFTRDELLQFLESENLKFDEWFSCADEVQM